MSIDIKAILNINKHQYQLMIMNRWLLWCDLNATDDLELQVLITNQSLFKWWLKEYKTLEARFIEIIKPYRTVKAQSKLLDIYTEVTIEIGNFYPKTLLYEIKKKRPKEINNKTYQRDRASLN